MGNEHEKYKELYFLKKNFNILSHFQNLKLSALFNFAL